MKKLIWIIMVFSSVSFAQIVYPGKHCQGHETKHEKLSGPRTGITLITGKAADKLKEKLGAAPLITQFGWQFEKRFTSDENDVAVLSEFVPLIGGLEQSLFLPSLSWLFGIRGKDGTEIGFGANLSVAGGAYVIAGGFSKQVGDINFPLNGSLVFSKNGLRFSILIGFNMKE